MKGYKPQSKFILIDPEFEAAVKETAQREESIHKIIHNALENALQKSNRYGVNKQRLLSAHNDLLKR